MTCGHYDCVNSLIAPHISEAVSLGYDTCVAAHIPTPRMPFAEHHRYLTPNVDASSNQIWWRPESTVPGGPSPWNSKKALTDATSYFQPLVLLVFIRCKMASIGTCCAHMTAGPLGLDDLHMGSRDPGIQGVAGHG